MTATNQPRQDDQTRFESLYVENYGSIYSYVARRVSAGGTADVADIAAEVFTVAWRRRANLPLAPEDRLWLFGVARKCVQAHFRNSNRSRNLVDRLISTRPRDVTVDSSGGSTDTRVAAALEALRPGDREVLMLALWDGLTHAEIASILHCSTNAVALRLKRARARVEVLLDLRRTPLKTRPLELEPPTIPAAPKLKEV
jgi:RNA polymerase sigma-70 factor (ECF subfamily)